MAVPLTDLVPRLAASLNAPGETFFDTTDEPSMVALLTTGFWMGHLYQFWTDFTIVADEIVPLDDTADDLSLSYQQLVVMFAALGVIEAKLLALPTTNRYKAGPVESEVRRSAELLMQLHKSKLAQLQTLREQLVEEELAATSIRVLDAFCAKQGVLVGELGYAWVR